MASDALNYLIRYQNIFTALILKYTTTKGIV